jgi:hypothetical protein
MSSQKTEHYQLHQWLPQDDFLRAEFNENFQKLDGALNTQSNTLGQKLEAVFGVYTGDGAANRVITLGFSPKALLLFQRGGLAGTASGSYYAYGGLVLPGNPLILAAHSDIAAEIVATGFALHHSNYCQVNISDWVYYYMALK